jgi:hypothetical protein
MSSSYAGLSLTRMRQNSKYMAAPGQKKTCEVSETSQVLWVSPLQWAWLIARWFYLRLNVQFPIAQPFHHFRITMVKEATCFCV